jgi:predicted ATPase
MENYEVYLTRYSQELENPSTNYVQIYKSSDEWNDYGIRAMYDICFKFSDAHPMVIYGKFKMLFYENFEERNGLEPDSDDQIKLDTLNSQFIGQIQEESVYRKLYSYFNGDIELIADILIKIRDAGTIKHISPDKLNLRRVENRFSNVLLRTSNARYAFQNGFYIISALDSSKRAATLAKKSWNLDVSNNKSDFRLKFDFKENNFLPSNINLLIGENGSGKSFILNQVVESFLGYDSFPTSDLPNFNRIVVMSNTIEDNYVSTKAQSYKRLYPGASYYYYNLISQKRFDSKLGVSRKYKTSQAVLDLLWRDSSEYHLFEKWQTFINILTDVLKFETVHLNVRGKGLIDIAENRILFTDPNNLINVDTKKDIVFKDNNGVIVPLSSGQITFVRFTLNLLSIIEQNSLVIIDEPENFLHPSLEIEYLKIVLRLLQETQSVGLIATHSAVLAREVPAQYVHVLKYVNGTYSSYTPKIETFGNDLNRINSYVFGDYNSDKIFEEYIADLSRGLQSYEDVVQKYQEVLPASIVSQIIDRINN